MNTPEAEKAMLEAVEQGIAEPVVEMKIKELKAALEERAKLEAEEKDPKEFQADGTPWVLPPPVRGKNRTKSRARPMTKKEKNRRDRAARKANHGPSS